MVETQENGHKGKGKGDDPVRVPEDAGACQPQHGAVICH